MTLRSSFLPRPFRVFNSCLRQPAPVDYEQLVMPPTLDQGMAVDRQARGWPNDGAQGQDSSEVAFELCRILVRTPGVRVKMRAPDVKEST